MANDLKLTRKSAGQISSIADAANSIRDLESTLDLIIQALGTNDDGPAAGNIKFIVREDDGRYHLWTLTAGAGMTLTPNLVTRVLTLTSP